MVDELGIVEILTTKCSTGLVQFTLIISDEYKS